MQKTRVMLASIAFRLEDCKRPFKLDQKSGILYMRARVVDVFLGHLHNAVASNMGLLKLDYVICHMVSRLTNLVMSWSQG